MTMSKLGIRGASTSLALGILVVLPGVYAQAQTATDTTISDAQSTRVKTSTAGDLTIDTTGSITVTSGAAVLIDSNNLVSNQGAITINDAPNDGTTSAGIRAEGGFKGTITNSGSISNVDSVPATAIPLTNGYHRFGIIVTGDKPFVGSIENQANASITILGNNSAGIAVGSIFAVGSGTGGDSGSLRGAITDAGTINVTGNTSFGIQTAGTVFGSIAVTDSIVVVGTNIAGEVGSSALSIGGNVGGRIYINSSISETGFYNGAETTARPATFDDLTADNMQIGGPTVVISKDVHRGIFVDTAGQVFSYGSSPAILIAPTSGSLRIDPPKGGGRGLLIAGDVEASGIYDGISANTVDIGSSQTGTAKIINGMGITGKVVATSYAANATAVSVLGGGIVPVLSNSGTISATVNFGAGGNAAVGGTATAILADGGLLRTVNNTGVISATTAAGSAYAMDLRGDTVHVTVNQLASTTSTPSSITGDVYFGSNGATLNLTSGELDGTVDFGGAKDNVLKITHGASMVGLLSQEDGGALAVTVANGRLASTSMDQVQLKSLNLGKQGEIDFAASPSSNQNGSFAVLGSISIASGAKVGLILDGQLTSPENFTVIETSGSTGALAGEPAPILGNVPYFYVGKLTDDAAAGTISISVRDRAFSEADVPGSASAYNAVFAANYNDPGIRDAFNAAGNQQSFKHLYQQMLPSYSGGLFELLQEGTHAVAMTEAANPMEENGKRGGGWAQQVGFGTQQSTGSDPGFHGGGLGFAFGWETPISTISSWGVSVSYIRGAVDDYNTGPQNEEVGTIYGVGAYWRENDGGLRTDVSLNAGFAEMNSTRNFSGNDLNGTMVTRSASSAWSGGAAQAHAGISYEQPLGDGYYVRPLVQGDYFVLYSGQHSEQNGGSGFNLNMKSNTGTQGSVTGGVAVGTRFGDKLFMWRPEMMVGYKAMFGGPDDTTAQFAGGQSFTLTPASQKSGGVAHLGVHGGNKFSDIAVEAGGEDRGDYKSFDGRVVARFRF